MAMFLPTRTSFLDSFWQALSRAKLDEWGLDETPRPAHATLQWAHSDQAETRTSPEVALQTPVLLFTGDALQQPPVHDPSPGVGLRVAGWVVCFNTADRFAHANKKDLLSRVMRDMAAANHAQRVRTCSLPPPPLAFLLLVYADLKDAVFAHWACLPVPIWVPPAPESGPEHMSAGAHRTGAGERQPAQDMAAFRLKRWQYVANSHGITGTGAAAAVHACDVISLAAAMEKLSVISYRDTNNNCEGESGERSRQPWSGVYCNSSPLAVLLPDVLQDSGVKVIVAGRESTLVTASTWLRWKRERMNATARSVGTWLAAQSINSMTGALCGFAAPHYQHFPSTFKQCPNIETPPLAVPAAKPEKNAVAGTDAMVGAARISSHSRYALSRLVACCESTRTVMQPVFVIMDGLHNRGEATGPGSNRSSQNMQGHGQAENGGENDRVLLGQPARCALVYMACILGKHHVRLLVLRPRHMQLEAGGGGVAAMDYHPRASPTHLNTSRSNSAAFSSLIGGLNSPHGRFWSRWTVSRLRARAAQAMASAAGGVLPTAWSARVRQAVLQGARGPDGQDDENYDAGSLFIEAYLQPPSGSAAALCAHLQGQEEEEKAIGMSVSLSAAMHAGVSVAAPATSSAADRALVPSAVPAPPSGRLAWVGWEANAAGALGPRRTALQRRVSGKADTGQERDAAGGIPRVPSSESLSALSTDAVRMHLSLMRWRQAPFLDPGRIDATRVLLVGAGTLGCHLARILLGWGFTRLTFLDGGRVAYSNPARQPLFEFADALHQVHLAPRQDQAQAQGAYKSVAAAAAVQRIHPGAHARSVVLDIPMPGHPGTGVGSDPSSDPVVVSVQVLAREYAVHDVVFLLTDTRESRWLPTLMAASAGFYGSAVGRPDRSQERGQDTAEGEGQASSPPPPPPLAITVALGFDTWVVTRHGCPIGPSTPTLATTATPSSRLACYFCNDVVAPADSISGRTLDQQCSVTRPGAAPAAAAAAAELLVTLLHHPAGLYAPADASYPLSSATPSPLGIAPHSIRTFMSHCCTMLQSAPAFDRCTACGPRIVHAFAHSGAAFIRDACVAGPAYLERVAGLGAEYKSYGGGGMLVAQQNEEEAAGAEAVQEGGEWDTLGPTTASLFVTSAVRPNPPREQHSHSPPGPVQAVRASCGTNDAQLGAAATGMGMAKGASAVLQRSASSPLLQHDEVRTWVRTAGGPNPAPTVVTVVDAVQAFGPGESIGQGYWYGGH